MRFVHEHGRRNQLVKPPQCRRVRRRKCFKKSNSRSHNHWSSPPCCVFTRCFVIKVGEMVNLGDYVVCLLSGQNKGLAIDFGGLPDNVRVRKNNEDAPQASRLGYRKQMGHYSSRLARTDGTVACDNGRIIPAISAFLIDGASKNVPFGI